MDGKKGKEALLAWAQAQTKSYKLNITNFTTSWTDGMGFCAIIHKNRPDLVKFDTLNKKDGLANLALAFSAFEKMGVPRILEPKDVGKNEGNVITYLSKVYWILKDGSTNKTLDSISVDQYGLHSGHTGVRPTTPSGPSNKIAALQGRIAINPVAMMGGPPPARPRAPPSPSAEPPSSLSSSSQLASSSPARFGSRLEHLTADRPGGAKNRRKPTKRRIGGDAGSSVAPSGLSSTSTASPVSKASASAKAVTIVTPPVDIPTLKQTVEKEIPVISKDLSDMIGKPVTFAVDWASFPASDTKAFEALTQNNLENVFGRLRAAFQEMTKDASNKTLISNHVKKFLIAYAAGGVSGKDAWLTDGELHYCGGFSVGASGCLSVSELKTIVLETIKLRENEEKERQRKLDEEKERKKKEEAEKQKKQKEEDNAKAKKKAEEEEKARKKKAEEEEKARKKKAEEEEKARKKKADEEEKARKKKEEEEEKARRKKKEEEEKAAKKKEEEELKRKKKEEEEELKRKKKKEEEEKKAEKSPRTPRSSSSASLASSSPRSSSSASLKADKKKSDKAAAPSSPSLSLKITSSLEKDKDNKPSPSPRSSVSSSKDNKPPPSPRSSVSSSKDNKSPRTPRSKDKESKSSSPRSKDSKKMKKSTSSLDKDKVKKTKGTKEKEPEKVQVKEKTPVKEEKKEDAKPKEDTKPREDTEARKKEEDAERKKKEEEAAAEQKKKEEQEAAERKKEEEQEAAERKKKEEAEQKKKEEADRKKKEEQEAADRKKKEEQEAADRKKKEEQEAAERKKKEEEAERKKKEEEAEKAKKEEAERKKKEEEEKKKKEAEEAEKKLKAEKEKEQAAKAAQKKPATTSSNNITADGKKELLPWQKEALKRKEQRKSVNANETAAITPAASGAPAAEGAEDTKGLLPWQIQAAKKREQIRKTAILSEDTVSASLKQQAKEEAKKAPWQELAEKKNAAARATLAPGEMQHITPALEKTPSSGTIPPWAEEASKKTSRFQSTAELEVKKSEAPSSSSSTDASKEKEEKEKETEKETEKEKEKEEEEKKEKGKEKEEESTSSSSTSTHLSPPTLKLPEGNDHEAPPTTGTITLKSLKDFKRLTRLVENDEKLEEDTPLTEEDVAKVAELSEKSEDTSTVDENKKVTLKIIVPAIQEIDRMEFGLRATLKEVKEAIVSHFHGQFKGVKDLRYYELCLLSAEGASSEEGKSDGVWLLPDTSTLAFHGLKDGDSLEFALNEDLDREKPVELEGYLRLLKRGIGKPPKYWFKTDGVTDRLLYFENENEIDLVGFIKLSNATIAASQRPSLLEIRTPKKVFFLQADTDNDKRLWIEGLEQHQEYLQKNASSLEGTKFKHGYLYKKGVFSWKRLLFVLDEEFLFYFREDSEEYRQAGKIALYQLKVRPVVGSFVRHKDKKIGLFRFELLTGHKSYVLDAESADDREQWIMAIREQVGIATNAIDNAIVE